jgi:predicted Mrr-cat superfamily restriction endonuclease
MIFLAGYWVMKTYKDWADSFIFNEEVGFDEDGVDQNYKDYTKDNPPIDNERLLRRFNQFCKWVKIGDYVIVGTGPIGKFNIKLIGRITGEYNFDADKTPYRHTRKIEIMKIFDTEIGVEKWSQAQRIELIDDNDFIDTLVNYCI